MNQRLSDSYDKALAANERLIDESRGLRFALQCVQNWANWNNEYAITSQFPDWPCWPSGNAKTPAEIVSEALELPYCR